MDYMEENATNFTTSETDMEHLDHHIHDYNDTSPVEWDISPEKWTAMGALTLLSIIFGLIPFLIFSYYRRVIRTDSSLCKIILAVLSSISGGVLLAVTMLHILPEVREKADTQTAVLSNLLGFMGGGSNIPPAEMLMLFGFCLIYGLEEIAQFMVRMKCDCASRFGHRGQGQDRNRRHHHHHHTHRHNSAHIHQEYGIGAKLDQFIPKANVGIVISECQHVELISRPECNKSSHFLDQNEASCGTPMSMTLSTTSDDEDSGQSSGLGSAASSPAQLRGSVLTLNNLEKELNTPMGALRSLVSLLALSFHAVMEGVAVGVQPSSDLWMTFGAIASHKCIIALCLGMEMMKSGMNWKTLVSSILIFSFVSPLGILIGSVMVSGDLAQSGWIVVIEGLATGTLVYIIFFEILPPSHDHSSGSGESSKDVREVDDNYLASSIPHEEPTLQFQGLLRFFGTFLGVLLAGYLISISPHSHSSASSLKDVHHNHDH